MHSPIGEKAWTLARPHSGQKARYTSVGKVLPPIQMQIFKSIIGTYSVLTVSITKRKRAFKWSHQRNRSYSHFAALHQLNEVSEKDVSVPLAETLSVIGHLQQRRAQREKKEKA